MLKSYRFTVMKIKLKQKWERERLTSTVSPLRVQTQASPPLLAIYKCGGTDKLITEKMKRRLLR